MIGHSEPRWQAPRTVLAAVDFEAASARAVALAGFLAAAHGATLRLLHAERVDAPVYFTPAQIARLEADRAEAAGEIHRELSRFAAAATAWPVEAEVRPGRPVEVILDAAEQADLVVMGTHGRQGPARWWLGSVAERVVRGAHVPVLVTRADTTPLTDVFARVVLVGHGAALSTAAAHRLEALVRSVGGAIAVRTALTDCRDDDLAAASMVAVVSGAGRSAWAPEDSATGTLGRCARPVLFLRQADV